MAMLTDTGIKNFKPTDKDRSEPDGNGLSILVKTDGKKQWIFLYSSPTQYTSEGKKQRRKTSFKYYPEVTLSVARKKASEYRELIAQGIDPKDYFDGIKAEAKKKANNNFECIADKMLNEFNILNLTKESFKKKKDIIYNDAIPYLGNKSITDITVDDIISTIKHRLSKPIHSAEGTLKKPTGIPTAKKLFRYINDVYRYAITHGLCHINPCNNIMIELIIPKHEEQHHAKITDEIELSQLIKDMYNYNGHFSTAGALKLLLHIPLRVNNLVNLKWSYIDFDNKSLTIPRNEMKTKNKNIPDYNVPLSDEVINILYTLYHFNGSREYIFYSVKDKPLNPNTLNTALSSIGYKNTQTVHGLRGVYRSIIETYSHEHNLTDVLKERFLDHNEKDKSKLAYVNQASYFNQMKPLVEWWSNYIIMMRDK